MSLHLELTDMIADIERLIASIVVEDATAPDVTGYHVVGVLAGVEGYASPLQHLGVSVHALTSRTTGRLRGRQYREVEDAIRVRLHYRINPQDQIACRTGARVHELRLRDEIDRHRQYRIQYAETTRTVTGAWYLIDLRFTAQRVESIAPVYAA